MKKVLFLLVSLSLLFFSCSKLQDPVSPESDDEIQSLEKSNLNYTNHYIVEYGDADISAAVNGVGGTVDRVFPELGLAQVSGLDSKSVKALRKKSGVKEVTQDILVQWVKPDQDAFNEHIGEDEGFWFLQWSMRAISAPAAWDAGFTGEGVRVAVIDGGMSAGHIDLDDNIDFTASKSFVDGYEWWQDDDTGPEGPFRHATHVAGIIAAEDNEIGTIGVAPGAEIIALKALHDGSGSFADIIAAIYYAAGEAQADVINMSLGAFFPRNSRGAAKLINAMGHAMNYANQQGVIVVVSAGNDGIDFDHAAMYVHVPSEVQHVINVSATAPTGFFLGGTDFDTPASYTNYGQSFVDFAAPGGDFDYPEFPTYLYDMIIAPGAGTSDYYFSAGTSMASPHVAGVVALILQKNGGLNPAQVESILKKSSNDLGKPGNDDYFGQGRVNAYNAVMY